MADRFQHFMILNYHLNGRQCCHILFWEPTNVSAKSLKTDILNFEMYDDLKNFQIYCTVLPKRKVFIQEHKNTTFEQS